MDLQEITKELIESINARKENILFDRINFISNFTYCKTRENKRRFKTVIRESHPNRESYYYNDGSEDGVHLVTFFNNYFEENCFGLDTKFEFKMNLQYTFDKT